MAKTKKQAWTLVQHTGYSVGGKLEFKRAVESRYVRGMDITKVVKAGGLLFDTYAAAEQREEEENYPPEVKGLVPRCAGSFGPRTSQGDPIYVPILRAEES